jgi:hypothetical protein
MQRDACCSPPNPVDPEQTVAFFATIVAVGSDAALDRLSSVNERA